MSHSRVILLLARSVPGELITVRSGHFNLEKEKDTRTTFTINHGAWEPGHRTYLITDKNITFSHASLATTFFSPMTRHSCIWAVFNSSLLQTNTKWLRIILQVDRGRSFVLGSNVSDCQNDVENQTKLTGNILRPPNIKSKACGEMGAAWWWALNPCQRWHLLQLI